MIPFDALDTFYFDDFIANLHPTLQPFAIDLHLLRHETDAEPLTTTKDLYQRQYLYIPFLLAEHFPLDEERLLTLGQAWLLQIIDFVITDNIIDGQAPDNPLLVLFHQQLRSESEKLLHHLLSGQADFWESYYTVYQALHNANALEIACVDMHQQPYTLQVMSEIYAARSGFFNLAVRMMGVLSEQSRSIKPFVQFYQKVSLSDQLLDDAADWRDDFQRGRYTLPIIKALEVADAAYEDAHTLTEQDFDHLIKQHRILQEMAQLAWDDYLTVQTLFEQQSLAESTLAQFLKRRIDVAQHALRRYDGLGFLQSFRRVITS